MTPLLKKLRCLEWVIAVVVTVLILIAIFCPAHHTHCPKCEYNPTYFEARMTNFCPECGTPYNSVEKNGRCATCGRKCKTPYCPYCGTNANTSNN